MPIAIFDIIKQRLCVNEENIIDDIYAYEAMIKIRDCHLCNFVNS